MILPEAGYLIGATENVIEQAEIRRSKLVQFAGDAGEFGMTLTQEAMQEFTSQSCDVTIPLIIAGSLGAAASLFGLSGIALPAIAAGAALIGSRM